MKIPEQPRSYRPGDVVNGHVLTEHGNWVPVAAPQQAPVQQAPVQQAPVQQGAGYPGTAQLPRVGATPSTAGPVPREAPSGTGPQIPVPAGWQVRERKPRRNGPVAVVTLVVVAFLLGQGILGFLRSIDDDDAPAEPAGLSAAEIAAVRVAALEPWHGPDGPGYVARIEAIDLERDLVGVSLAIQAYADDGETLLGTGTGWVYVGGGHRATTIGTITPAPGADLDAEVTTLHAELTVSETLRANPRLLVEETTVDDGASPVTARVTITAAPLASTDAAVHVVVRDAAGEVVTAATRIASAVAAAEPVTVDVPLGLATLDPDHTVEAFAAPM